ncbi:MAG: hypothetical protein KDC14_05375 [Planctomycetes bacterium]|nr:hypothetical protein [Planctomycetota bacterium]
MSNQATTPFADGRDQRGRFSKGNSGGPGNPHAAQVGRLRSAMLNAIGEDDIRELVARLLELAKSGEIRAIKEVLDRTLGRPVEADLLERLEQLEALLSERGQS